MIFTQFLLALVLSSSSSHSQISDAKIKETVVLEAQQALSDECGESGAYVFYDEKPEVGYTVYRSVFKNGFVKFALREDLERLKIRSTAHMDDYEFQIIQINCLKKR